MCILLLRIIFIKVVTPVSLVEMFPYLRIWSRPQAADLIINGVQFGFLLPSYSGVGCLIVENLLSVDRCKDVIKQKIAIEVLAGRVVGPFCYPPFKFQDIPIGYYPYKGC